MYRDSLNNLLKMFPYFFNKEPSSNFYKSQSITNNQFKDLYQSLFEVLESFHILKRCLIWKVQNEAYNYFIHFVVNCPSIKSVDCYKNDELIYSEEYSYEDNVDSFVYIYDSLNDNNETTNSVNNFESISEENVIPDAKFRIVVETYDEKILEKGFPENDKIENNIFDHDLSLDRIGKLVNIPRKKYVTVDIDDYPNTEPPFNNSLTEDDYHYMTRIINYNLLFWTTPLPVLEIWKLYGIKAEMVNRDKYLLKMFDIFRHPHNDEGEVLPWKPQIWEHKDKFCNYDNDLGEFFFVSANTISPMKNTDIIFTFDFLNSLAQKLPNDNYKIDIKLNETSLKSNYQESAFKINSSSLDESNSNIFEFTVYKNEVEFAYETIIVTVRGCNNADYYVSPGGDDSNDGRSLQTSFASISKAISCVQGSDNLIAIANGEYEIIDIINVPESCNILGCGEVTITSANSKFFRIPVNSSLNLQDITLQYDNSNFDCDNTVFINKNGNNQPVYVCI